MESRDLAVLTIRASAAIAAGGVALAEPLAGLAAAGLIPVLDQAVGRWQAAQARNAGKALDEAVEVSALAPEDFLGRLTQTPARLLLLGSALNAAAQSTYEERVRALGRALASGALAADDARVDEEQLWVAVMADIDAPHLRIIQYLMRDHPDRQGPMVTQQPTLAEVAGASYLMTGRLLATLERHDLAKWRWGESYPRAYPESRGGWASEKWWQRGGLTAALIDRFHAAGDVQSSPLQTAEGPGQ
ncbi:hypothetical protein [Salinispora arenicola]|uniref:hypothetical protein n=1 Tax=Salinispora arenicola TaxID=168697 RepID=UPI0012BD0CD4|nr:hypothetical protein [Salinispora arenicola]